MLLSQFQGGLNSQISPHLISINEGQIYNNIDNSSVSLKPFKGHTATLQNFGSDRAFTYFRGQWISSSLGTSFVEYNDSLYWTTGNGPLMKTNDGLVIKDVGLNAPRVKLTAQSNEEPTFTMSNVPSGSLSDIPAGTHSYIHVVYFGDKKHSYVQQDYIYSGTMGIRVTFSGMSNVTRLMSYRLYNGTYRLVGEFISNVLNDTKHDISTNGGYSFLQYTSPADIRAYRYTYYNIDDGTESAPSPSSEEVEVTSGAVTITGFASTSEAATHIRLYRLGGNLTNYTLVAELPLNTITYNDSKTDLDIAESDLLTTEGKIKPKVNMNYLTEYSSTLFGAIGNTLYYSESGLVENWSEFNFIKFPETITGLGPTQNGLLVFSKNSTHILIGTDNTNFAKILLNKSQGCVAHLTIAYASNTLIWQSLDGICVSNGSNIEVITKQKLGKLDLSPVASVVYDNEYYLFHEDGVLVVENLNIFKTIDLIVRGASYVPTFDKLYFIEPVTNVMYSFGDNEAEPMEFHYKSGWLAENGLTNVKIFKNIYVYSLGEVNLTVYMDGTQVFTGDLVEGFNDIKLPSSSIRAYYPELEFKGIGIVKEVEFKVEGRQNGR